MGKSSFFSRLKVNFMVFLLLVFFVWLSYHELWGKHLYRITAYCNCPVCIDIPAYRDGRFASGKEIYWGGVAADRRVPFESRVELLPIRQKERRAVRRYLNGRRRYVVEDRGGKIRGRRIDIFIPDSLGGHKTARKWGVRYMRIKINGKIAE